MLTSLPNYCVTCGVNKIGLLLGLALTVRDIGTRTYGLVHFQTCGANKISLLLLAAMLRDIRLLTYRLGVFQCVYLQNF